MDIKHGIIKLHQHKSNKPILININEIVAVAQSTSKDYTIIHILDYKDEIILINVEESVTHIYNLIKDIIPSITVHSKNKNTELLIPTSQILFITPYFEIEKVEDNDPNYYHKVLSSQINKGKECSRITFKTNISPVEVNETVQKIYNKI
jgi:hypothetical protein